MFNRARSIFTLSFAVFFMLAALSIPEAGWAVPGDPDNDGVPTIEETASGTAPMLADSDGDGLDDGMEALVTGTDALDADSDDDLSMDGASDTDTGLIPDGNELANGADPLNSEDDSKLKEITLNSPIPVYPDFNPVEIPMQNPIEVDWSASPTEYSSYIIQFDDSRLFDSPVSRTYAPGATMEELGLLVDKKWPAVTRQGRVVYWRVLGVENSSGRKHSSNIMSFTVTGGPALIEPADSITVPASTRPVFTWESAPGLKDYRLIFTGSHKLGTATVQIPVKGWLTGNSYRPGRRNWKKITNLGNEIIWRVVGRDAEKRWGYSEDNKLKLTGGAALTLAEVEGADPDEVPTFSATRGDSARFRFLFSSSEDFSSPGFAYPSPMDWGKAEEDGTISYTPTPEEWNAITALGPDVFWTVMGKYGLRYFTYSPIQRYGILTPVIISEAAVPLDQSGPNAVLPSLPSYSFTSDPLVSEGYRVIFGGNPRMAGARAISPSEGFSADPNWTMPSDFAADLAMLDKNYVYMMVQGQTTAGNSFFSQPYLLKSTEYLRSPVLEDIGDRVDKEETYTVSWQASPDDTGGAVLYYQLQEATNKKFTRNLRCFNVYGTSLDFAHSEVSGKRIFRYRVRAVNSVGHSAWSNKDKKVVVGVIQPKSPRYYVKTTRPFDQTGNNIILDDNNAYNTKGRFRLYGPGWDTWGGGYNGVFHYVTRFRMDGTERATWTPNISKAGTYEVWVGYRSTINRSTATPYYIHSAEGTALYHVNQKLVDQTSLTWAKLGRYQFNEGTSGYIEVVNGDGHSEEADAVGLKYISP